MRSFRRNGPAASLALKPVAAILIITAVLLISGGFSHASNATQASLSSSPGLAGGGAKGYGAPCGAPCEDYTTGQVTYHGGVVMHHAVSYIIFWIPSGYNFDNSSIDPSATNPSNGRYESIVEQYFGDVGGSAFYNIIQQYPDGSGPPGTTTLGGVYIDTSAFPGGRGTYANPLSMADLYTEAHNDILAKGWSSNGGNNGFYIFTPDGVYNTLNINPGFCAWHSWFSYSTTTYIYSVITDPGTNFSPYTCMVTVATGNNTVPNNDPLADSVISLTAHEQIESVTDPRFDGWYYLDLAHEVADECAWQFGTRNANGGNVYMNGHYYVIQELWSNKIGGCYLPPYGLSTAVTLYPEGSSNGISSSNEFAYTYKAGGYNVTGFYDGGLLNVTIDPATYILFSPNSTGSTSSERWVFDSTNQPFNVLAGSTVTAYYYDLLAEPVHYAVLGGGSPPTPSLTYYTAPPAPSTTPTARNITQALPLQPQTAWVVRGTTLSVMASVPGGAGERWATRTNSWSILQSNQVPSPIAFYHQYHATFAFNVIGGGTGYSPPQASYNSFGTSTETGMGTYVWADAAGYTFSTTLPGSSPTERWEVGPGGSGVVSAAGQITADYYNQVPLLLTYQVADGGSPGAPSVTGTYLGQSGSADCAGISPGKQTPCWLDEGSSFQIGQDLLGSTATERWHSNGASGTLSAPPPISLTFYHQFYVGVSYGIIDGGSPGAPSLTFRNQSIPASYQLTQAPAFLWIDATNWSVPTTLTGSTPTERWSTATANGMVGSSSPISPAYYHQFAVTASYSISDNSQAAAPMLTYSSFGTSTTAPLGKTAAIYWLDAGSSYQMPGTLTSSTSTERWYTGSTSGVVSGPTVVSPTYFHQFLETLSFTVVGGGSPTAPSVTLTELGATTTAAAATDRSSQQWVDAGTTTTYQLTLSPSTSTERWQAPSQPVFTATASAIFNPSYYHQFLETLSYSVIDGGSPTAPTFSADQFGSTLAQSLTTSPTGYWFDSGASWTVSNPLVSSTSSERWELDLGSGGTLSSSATQKIQFPYYHQYALTISYATNGRGTPTAPTLNSTQLGQTSTSTLSTTPTTYWLDSGSSWKLPALLLPSTTSERWISNGTLGSTVASSSTARVVYQLQYYVTVTVAATGGGTASPSSNWYADASSLNLTASPTSGWALGTWAGVGPSSYSGNAVSEIITVDGAINETAVFYPGLTITDGGNGQISYQWGTSQGSLPSGTTIVYVPVGTTVSLSASPSSLFYIFNGYTGAVNSGNAASSVLVNGPAAVTASFGLNYVVFALLGVAVLAVIGGAVYYARRPKRTSSGGSDWKKGLGS